MRLPVIALCCFVPFAAGLAIAAGTTAASAAETNPAAPKTIAEAEADYARKIEDRVANIITPLKLEDPAKSAKVHDRLIAQYRFLRDWHDANDASRKKAAGDDLVKINASLKAQRDKFLAGLSAELTPAQVEVVKDAMTYNKVKVTYDAYCEIIPTLTEAQKAKILEFLKEAREEAIDGGSADEKSAIFKKYKGRIANYLSKEGVDETKARKEWGAKQKEQKEKAAAATNAPATK